MNPFKSLKYLLWNNYKMCLIKFLVIGLLVALMGLFFYSMPVRALLKYEHCKIPLFQSAPTLVGDNCLGFASLYLSEFIENVLRRKMKNEIITICAHTSLLSNRCYWKM